MMRVKRMRKTVNIGGKDTELVANAASPYLYKMIFKEDFLKRLQDNEPDLEIVQKMAFVMAKQAEITNMTKLAELSTGDYLEWLLQFEPMDILTASEEIMKIYLGQTKGTSVPKPMGD